MSSYQEYMIERFAGHEAAGAEVAPPAPESLLPDPQDIAYLNTRR